MKRTYKYEFDVPVWSVSKNASIGYVRANVHYYFHGSPGEWTYIAGDYDIDSMELIGCTLADFILNQHNDTDRVIMDSLDIIVNSLVSGFLEEKNDEENTEMEADEAYQRANEADYPTLNRQFIHP